jgi:hypothetical protein
MARADLGSPEDRPPHPTDSPFAAGLRNIRAAIESRLAAFGVKEMTVGDTASQCVRDKPGMVIIDVAAEGKTARVTFTRGEVEDCARRVEVHCVLRKIENAVRQIRQRERRARPRTAGSTRRIQ